VLSAALLLLAGYLIGAIPFGYLVARCKGVDILRQGSGNIGATNVGRVLGRPFGLLVFVLDFAKGALPTLAGQLAPQPEGWPPNTLAALAGVAAFLGHMFPIYLRFRGGKGVATGAGVVAMLLPVPLLGALLIWLAVVLATRYVSLASVLAALFLAGQRLLFTSRPWDPDHRVVTLFCVLAAVLVLLRHRGNLRRLWQGNENQLKESASMLHLARSLHVLALGTCFGAQVLFTIVGLVLFQTFDQISRQDAADRPIWLPVAPEFAKAPPGPKFPDPLRREQGSRVAGAAVSPMFVYLYGLQTGCVLLALACAWSWRGSLQRLRLGLLLLAVLLLGVGWWMDFKVHELRGPRDQLTDEVLRSSSPTPTQIQAAEQARAAFGMWHGFSLMQHFATMIVVGIALALAGQLPASDPR
jgi:acyl-phosphate glycerol 3-phosphate acyltransferase